MDVTLVRDFHLSVEPGPVAGIVSVFWKECLMPTEKIVLDLFMTYDTCHVPHL